METITCEKLLKDYLSESRKIIPYRDKLQKQLRLKILKKVYEEKDFYFFLRLLGIIDEKHLYINV